MSEVIEKEDLFFTKGLLWLCCFSFYPSQVFVKTDRWRCYTRNRFWVTQCNLLDDLLFMHLSKCYKWEEKTETTWFTGYFDLDYIYPFCQVQLLSLVQSQISQDLSLPTVFLCPPLAHHPTVWLFVFLIILLKPASKASRSLSPMNIFQLLDFSAALMQWTVYRHHNFDYFWRVLAGSLPLWACWC